MPDRSSFGNLRIAMPYRILGFIFVVLAAACVCRAYGYAWPSGPQFVASADGSVLLRIEPDNRWLTQPNTQRLPPTATVFRFDAKTESFQMVSKFVLRNHLMPSKAFISNGAQFIVTLDDWEPEEGSTPNAVVVYLETGELVKSWSLEDIFSKKEIGRFGFVASDVPARRWRGDPAGIANAYGPNGEDMLRIPSARELKWQVTLTMYLSTDASKMVFEKHPERDIDR